MTDLLDRTPAHAHDRPRIDPRIARRWVETRRQEGRRRLRILIGAASVVGVAGLAGGALFTPLFAAEHIHTTITGGPGVSPAQVVAEAGLAHHPQMVTLDAAAVAARLDADPRLGGARVVKHWPSTVDVTVAVRAPVAQVAAGGTGAAGAPLYVPVDGTGRVLGAAGARIRGLPVLAGVGSVPAPGGWLAGTPGPGAQPGSPPAKLVDMVAASGSPDVPSGPAGALAFLRALPPALVPALQSVTVGTGAGITLVVVPPRSVTGSLTVSLGDPSQLSAKLTALETLLGQADLSGISALDLSVPSRPAATPAQAPTSASSTSTGGATPRGSSSATGGATPSPGSGRTASSTPTGSSSRTGTSAPTGSTAQAGAG